MEAHPPALDAGDALFSSLAALCSQEVRSIVGTFEEPSDAFDPEILIPPIYEIVYQNLLSGRMLRVLSYRKEARGAPTKLLHQFASSSMPPTVPLINYIHQVIHCYITEHPRISRLQTHEAEEWNRLTSHLARIATRLLRQWNPRGHSIHEASEFVQETCEIVCRTLFPYDVPFDAWATVILTNCFRTRYLRSRDINDRPATILSLEVSEDATLAHYLDVSDPAAHYPLDRLDLQPLLDEAIAALPTVAQRQVITLTYVYDYSDDKIATHLGRTKNAIHQLRHRALKELRTILQEQLPYL